MKLLNYLFIFVLLLSFGMSTSFYLNYDKYVDLNDPTTITFNANQTTTSNPVMVYDTTYTYLNTTDNQSFYVNLVSDVEDYFEFTMYEVSNESEEFFGYDTLIDDISITDDTVYIVHQEQKESPVIPTKPHNVLICPKFGTNNQDRTIRYYIGIKNGTDSDPGLHSWDYIDFTKNYDDITTSCEYLKITVPYLNYTLHSGIQCLDCNPGQIVYLGIGNNSINASHYYNGDNFTGVSEYPDLDYDLGISMHDEFLVDVVEPQSGAILFTESYDVNIDFINNGNLTSSLPNYDYIYIQKDNIGESNNDFLDDILYFEWTDKLLGLDSSSNIDTTTSFWAPMTNNKATVELYETGNYTINLISAKVFNTDYWDYPFLYPQNDEFSYSKNVATFEINNKTNTNLEIHLDAYEIDKTKFTTNLIRNIFILVVYFICIAFIGLLSKSAWVTGAIGTITLPIILKLLGL